VLVKEEFAALKARKAAAVVSKRAWDAAPSAAAVAATAQASEDRLEHARSSVPVNLLTLC
jgi:hypothetical protein